VRLSPLLFSGPTPAPAPDAGIRHRAGARRHHIPVGRAAVALLGRPPVHRNSRSTRCFHPLRQFGRIHLAGDYLGGVYTETAIESGEAAASAISTDLAA